MKKLILFDIDGTIITDGEGERIIPDSVLTTLHTLRKNGHLCFINTGRAFAEVDKQIRSLPFDGYICGCGTYIEYQGNVLLSHTIPFEEGNRLIRTMDSCRLEWLLEGTNAVYYSARDYRTHIGDFKAEHQILIPDAFHSVTPDEAVNLSFDKFCICLDNDSDFPQFYQLYQNKLTFIDRGNSFYEIVPKGFSKASGIAFLENHFDIPHEDTIAVGDSTNDLPMLNYAAYSIAMGNGTKQLFDVVDYVTDSVLDDGILHAMQHLKLI
jgi:hypothetical protein